MGEFPTDRSRSGDRSGRSTWVVVLEATAGPRHPPFEFEFIRQLVTRLVDWRATGLYCSDRYAVQLDIVTVNCSEALRLALAAHQQAVDELVMAPPVFLRAEVLTPEVLNADWQAEIAAQAAAGDQRLVPTRVYEATRALVRAISGAEIRRTLADFVTYSGGSVIVGPCPTQAGVVTADLAVGPNEEIYAMAEALSVSGMLLEGSLPTLVEDARRAFQRLRRQPDPR